MTKTKQVDQVTKALLGFSPGVRIVFVDGGEELIAIGERLGEHGTLFNKHDSYPGIWAVLFDDRAMLWVHEGNLVHEKNYDG